MYQQKYLKYKKKYSELKLQIGGGFYEEEEWFKKTFDFLPETGNKDGEIVINSCHGGFSIPKILKEKILELRRKEGILDTNINYHDGSIQFRTDRLLIQAIKDLGGEVKATTAHLIIKKFDSNAIKADAISISEYDGFESHNINNSKLIIYYSQNAKDRVLASNKSESEKLRGLMFIFDWISNQVE
jgi:hypothetical protein